MARYEKVFFGDALASLGFFDNGQFVIAAGQTATQNGGVNIQASGGVSGVGGGEVYINGGNGVSAGGGHLHFISGSSDTGQSGDIRLIPGISGVTHGSVTIGGFQNGGNPIARFLTEGSGDLQFGFANDSVQSSITKIENGVADANPAGNLSIQAGNKTAGTGNGGDLTLSGGTSVGGNPGVINLLSWMQVGDSVEDTEWTLVENTVADAATASTLYLTGSHKVAGTGEGGGLWLASGNSIGGKGGTLSLAAGSATLGTGDGGDVVIQGGTSAGGVAGTISLQTNNAEIINISASGLVQIGEVGGTEIHAINGAVQAPATGVLTLTNGPGASTGNPTVYLTLNINGTNYVVPAWVY